MEGFGSEAYSQDCMSCGSKIRLVQINFTEAIHICQNPKCIYPFDSLFTPLEFVKRDFMSGVEEEGKPQIQSDSPLKSLPQRLTNDNYDFLDNFFANCNSDSHQLEMSEDDIQTVHSLFETLQSFEV